MLNVLLDGLRMPSKKLSALINNANELYSNQVKLTNDVNELIRDINKYTSSNISTDPKLFTIGLTDINELVKQYIEYATIQCNGNKTQAAQILGIARSTMWRLTN